MDMNASETKGDSWSYDNDANMNGCGKCNYFSAVRDANTNRKSNQNIDINNPVDENEQKSGINVNESSSDGRGLANLSGGNCERSRRKVLIAMDGSCSSVKAFHWYVRYIRYPEDDVIVGFYPVLKEKLFSLANFSFSDLDSANNASMDAHDRAMESYRSLEAELKHAEVFGNVHTLSGHDAAHAIVAEAQREAVNLVVMGSRSISVVRKAVSGSVSSHVLHHSSVPVLICPHHFDDDCRQDNHHHRHQSHHHHQEHNHHKHHNYYDSQHHEQQQYQYYSHHKDIYE